MSLQLSADAHVRRVVQYFETMSPAALDSLDQVYRHDAVFEDPFNRVAGVSAVRRIYARMFDTLEAPRFAVTETLVQGERAVLVWDFTFRRRGRVQEWRIHGSSHLRFALDGRIVVHRDYWDAASQLYEHVPVLGTVLRMLRRRMAEPG